MGTIQQEIQHALGISAGRVSQLKKRGMPVDDVDRAREWHRTRSRSTAVAVPMPRQSAPRMVTGDDPEPEEYHKARARREAAEADIAERKAAELAGVLVRRDVFVIAAEKRANMVREALLQMPAQLAPVVAAESDLAKCQDALMDAALSILARISA